METPKCRLCGAPPSLQKVKGSYVYGGKEYHKFWECSECGAVYLHPPLAPEEERRFYREEFEKYMVSRSGGDIDWSGPERHIKTNQETVMRRWRILKDYLKPGMRLLEVGCSSGFMLDVFKQNGLEIVGIEPSGGFLNFLRSKGYKVYESWEDFRSSEAAPFDVIAHFFVLEHIREPVEFLRSQLEVLKAGGRIIFEVPCVNDPLVTLYKVPAFDRFYWSIAHHWYFSSRSLSFILNKLNCRFKLIPEQRYDLSNHIVWMLEGKPGGQGRFSSIFSDELIARYNEDLKQHWICDTIFCVLEKP